MILQAINNICKACIVEAVALGIIPIYLSLISDNKNCIKSCNVVLSANVFRNIQEGNKGMKEDIA